MNLHPRLRDHSSAVIHDVNDEDHALAHLEHHRHGVEIVRFFLMYAFPSKGRPLRGFRIAVHSRFDEHVDPFFDAPTLCLDDSLEIPYIDLRLYNNTGNGITRMNYDPVFLKKSQSQTAGHKAKTCKTCKDSNVSKKSNAT